MLYLMNWAPGERRKQTAEDTWKINTIITFTIYDMHTLYSVRRFIYRVFSKNCVFSKWPDMKFDVHTLTTRETRV